MQPFGKSFVIVGNGGAIARYLPGDGGVETLGGGTCANYGNLLGVSVRASDSAVFVSTSSGSLIRWVSPGQCTGVNALNPGSALTAVNAEGSDFIFTGSMSAFPAGTVVLSRVDDAGVPSQQPFMSVPGEVWEIARSGSSVFAVGSEHAVQRRGRIWRYDFINDAWGVSLSTGNDTAMFAVDLVSPNAAYAAGMAFAQWNGSNWGARATPPFGVYGLEALSASEVYAVGDDAAAGRPGIAVWDGNTWTNFGPTTRPTGYLVRVRGESRCGLFGVGSNGIAITTFP